MLTSFFALQNSVEQLSNAIREIKTYKASGQSTSIKMMGATPAPAKMTMFKSIAKLVIAILFFMVELFLLFYLLKYVYVSSTGAGRAVKIILLIFFTMPFALLAATSDPDFAAYINRS